jgi:ATP-dependent exoDNAse (exonuclease V) alpha subunit
MIIKNLECWLVNWDLWEVVKITKDYITIKSDRLEQEFDIETETWKNITYNEHWEEQVHGKFIQYPIKLWWALTAHKSQGTTLDKVVFHYKPYMQRELVYVWLSRATSFEWLYINK